LPTECIDSAAWAHELEAIQPAPEFETDLLVSPTIPLRSSLTTALTGDVKFTHGVSLNFEVPADGSGKVTIKNTYTKQQVVFEFGTREAPAAVLNALVPLKDKIAQAVTHGSVTPGLFEEIAAVLSANADAIPVVEQKKEFVSGVLQAAPGAKGSRLSITSEGFSDDLVRLLRSSESAELAYQSPDKAVGWNAIRIERDYTGVFVTMSSDGVAGKVAPASMKFRVDDGSSDRTVMSDKFRWFFGLINSGGLARPQIGSGAFGTGTVVDRFYEKCELQEASNVALAKVTTPEIKLSATAKLENVRIIDGEFSLVGKGDGNQAQLDGVTFEGSSKVTLVGLEGSKLKETVAQKTASLQGSLSRSQFEGCYFWGESAGTLELNDITWKKGTKNELPGLAPKNAKLA
jgi:hypothetical protein